MNANDIRSAFAAMTADVDAVRVANDVRLRIRESSRKVRFPYRRMVLIAACVMLILSACAIAVYQYQTGQLVLAEDGSRFEFNDVVIDTPVTFPDSVLEELPQYAELEENVYNPHEIGKKFTSWKEAADWLDCGLLTSDLISDNYISTKLGKITLYADYDRSSHSLLRVSVQGTAWLKGEEAYCHMTVLIPQYTSLDGHGYHFGRMEDDYSQTEIFQIKTKNGFELEIPVLPPETDGPSIKTNFDGYTAYAHFSSGGIIYYFEVTHENPTAAVDLLVEVIESLE